MKPEQIKREVINQINKMALMELEGYKFQECLICGHLGKRITNPQKQAKYYYCSDKCKKKHGVC